MRMALGLCPRWHRYSLQLPFSASATPTFLYVQRHNVPVKMQNGRVKAAPYSYPSARATCRSTLYPPSCRTQQDPLPPAWSLCCCRFCHSSRVPLQSSPAATLEVGPRLPSVPPRECEHRGHQTHSVHAWCSGDGQCLWMPGVPEARYPLVTSDRLAPPLQRWGGPRRKPDGGRFPGRRGPRR